MKELESKYNPQEMEERIYKEWTDNKYFHAEVDKSKKPFTIVMPPPNVTGQLHMGHALDETLQDILIRTKRMQGYSALWVPGTDHASIATEVKVVNKLLEEGIKKEDLTRERFLEEAWKWKEEYEGRILGQLKKLGASADWDRTRFTMDDGLSNAVLTVFKKMYDEGLIYRGEKLINWCPKCKTTISDAEVEYQDLPGNFYHLRYQIEGTDDYLELATTRPETMFGDTAVAINENDERYKKYHGKNVILPIVNKVIPIVCDEHADPEFGTGVVKITPGHDPNDYEVGKRHNLEIINVINDDGTMNKNAGKYAGMDRYECRKQLIKDLEADGILLSIEPHNHNVGTHDRCHEVIEPLVKKQWFVAMETLAKPALEKYNSGDLKIVPDKFGKTYTNWLENIRDWCISRQLWWGHRIPAYYCDDCDEMIVTLDGAPKCPKCGKEMRQDEDVLDTWFSSALWPFSTLGWPDKTPEMEYFYPTNVLVTGYDIIFFWVIRMVFSALHNTDSLPFNDVLIHGIVRDSQGRKMSKSLGNGIDPLEVIKNYGADALRLALVSGNAPGNDMRYSDDKVEAARNFANKVWNATRFIQMNIGDTDLSKLKFSDLKLEVSDKWILSKINKLVKNVTKNIDIYEFGVAVDNIQDFLWSEYCDWYIEMCKSRFKEEGDSKLAALWTLNEVLKTSMKLLHPFMPFITEEIYTTLQDEDKSIMISAWPEYKSEYEFEEDEEDIEILKTAIREIRNIKAEKNIAPSKKIKIKFVAASSDIANVFEEDRVIFESLANAESFDIVEALDDSEETINAITSAGTIAILAEGLVDKKAELEKLEKERKRLQGEVELVTKKLSNEGFVSKAPAQVIEGEKAKKAKYEEMLSKVEEEIAKLK